MATILLSAGRKAPWGEKAGQPSFFSMTIHCETVEEAERFHASLPKGLGAYISTETPTLVGVWCWALSLRKLQRTYLASMDYLAVNNLAYRWSVTTAQSYGSSDEFAEELNQLVQQKGK